MPKEQLIEIEQFDPMAAVELKSAGKTRGFPSPSQDGFGFMAIGDALGRPETYQGGDLHILGGFFTREPRCWRLTLE